MMKRVELLSPAGDMERLELAVKFGADAVYVGGTQFGMRSNPSNFDPAQLQAACKLVHAAGKKLYLTCNTLPRSYELDALPDFLRSARAAGVDAFIIADMGVLAIAKQAAPEVEVHISTQAGIVNYAAANAFYQMGAKRIVTARELSLDEIKMIRDHTPPELEIEAFVHGAMCMSFSGRCILSDYMVGRDANRGDCAQPCRWKYHLMEETRPGQYFPINQEENGTYIFNSKDLCMIEHIPELVEAGVDSFKIEGRMKTALYVADVARTYRQAIDDYFDSPELYAANLDHYRDEISKCTYRQFTTGFFYGPTTHESQIYDNNTYVKKYTYLGLAGGSDEQGFVEMEQRNKFAVGDQVEIMKPSGENVLVTVEKMKDEDGRFIENCPHPKQKIHVLFSQKPDELDLIRVREEQ